MDDIDKAQIGQQREVAHEIYKHPATPQTNLKPMKAKNALLTPNAIRVRQSSENSPTSHSNKRHRWFWFIVVVGVVGIIAAKLLGLW